MADLNVFERSNLEKLFAMKDGYVLNFSNGTYANFFADYKIDIYSGQFNDGGSSKARLMRSFWNNSQNNTVGRVIDGLINYGVREGCFAGVEPLLIANCKKISRRLLSDQTVVELDALTSITDEWDFELVAEHVREAIEKNQPEGGLDRLHTYVTKFIRVICKPYGITINRDKPLHSIFGEYVRALRTGGHLESTMTDCILKTNISVLENFNHVRNNKSLAHDNPILNYEESLLIFNHIAALIRFIKSLEIKIHALCTGQFL